MSYTSHVYLMYNSQERGAVRFALVFSGFLSLHQLCWPATNPLRPKGSVASLVSARFALVSGFRRFQKVSVASLVSEGFRRFQKVLFLAKEEMDFVLMYKIMCVLSKTSFWHPHIILSSFATQSISSTQRIL